MLSGSRNLPLLRKQQRLGRTVAKNHKRDFSFALYVFLVVMETVLLYSGFSLVLSVHTPPHYRMIGALVIFPVAAASAWWGGNIALQRRGEQLQRQDPILIFSTLPIRILFGVLLAALVVSIFALLGNL